MLTLALIVILTGCVNSNELEFPVSDTGFPIGFTRVSDGAQIRLGMHRDEIEAILESVDKHRREAFRLMLETVGIEYDESLGLYLGASGGHITIQYNSDNIAYAFNSVANDWVLAGEISLGDDVQDVINIERFPHYVHDAEKSEFFIFDDHNFSTHSLLLFYDETGRIESMNVSYTLDFLESL